MMKITYLCLGVSLVLIPVAASGQCVATQDCATLGYTESSCAGGNGVKCPFGNYWACLQTEEEICNKYGFTQSCNGAGQTGLGRACNGKYFECKCPEGYVWNDGECKSEHPVCEIGNLYYSDNTCSSTLDSSKTLLGVVVYSNGASGGGWIMTLEAVKRDVAWGGYGIDTRPNITASYNLVNEIQRSCVNTDAITAKGTSSTFPAAWAAKNYRPQGTPSDKTWCLPSAGLLQYIISDPTNLDIINNAITIAGGKKIGDGNIGASYEYVWSSTEYNDYSVWMFGNGDGSVIGRPYEGTRRKDDSANVRAVMEF